MTNEERINIFREGYCSKCKNKEKDKCHITNTINNKLECIEYEEKQNEMY